MNNIDPNLVVDTTINESDIKFHDVRKAPFEIYGVFYENGSFRRMPEDVAKRVSDGVYTLHTHTTGGRVRFKTDSEYVAVHVKMPDVGRRPHFALTGSAGFDLYVGNTYKKIFIPPLDIEDGYESIVHFGGQAMREITINFPIFSQVSEFYIGLSENAQIVSPTPYKIQKPIVYYGSSITHGACASRPGNTYENIISRRFSCDYVNLGFAGNAKGEEEIANYIKNLDMSVFVYDYDHNAPSLEHLEQTHENMFKIIRNANPTLPIVIMPRPVKYLWSSEQARFDVIKRTYDNAKARGDENVYLIDGATLMEIADTDGTVDGCHPNDLGFYSMAKALGDVLEKIL